MLQSGNCPTLCEGLGHVTLCQIIVLFKAKLNNEINLVLLFDICTVVFVCFMSSLLCAHMPQLILYHLHDIPFPVLMSHIYFRFFLILSVTFEVSSHK